MHAEATASLKPGIPSSGQSWFARLRRHPVFPLILFVLACQIIRDNYPFSHYPMYSRPSTKPLPFQYLADANGKPLPVVWHTGFTPSRVGKKFGTHKQELHDAELKAAKRENREPRPEVEFKAESARLVLAFLREQSLKRKKHRQLPEDIQLRESTVWVEDGKLVRTDAVVGTLQ